MQFSTVSLAALTLVSAKSITLSVEAENPAFQNKGISNIHFGAGINGALISDSPVEYKLNSTTGQVYEEILVNGGDDISPYSARVIGNDLTFGIAGEPFALLENNYLTINGSSSAFYACKSLEWDPYGYTKNQKTYGVGVYAADAPSGCEPIKIRGAAIN